MADNKRNNKKNDRKNDEDYNPRFRKMRKKVCPLCSGLIKMNQLRHLQISSPRASFRSLTWRLSASGNGPI